MSTPTFACRPAVSYLASSRDPKHRGFKEPNSNPGIPDAEPHTESDGLLCGNDSTEGRQEPRSSEGAQGDYGSIFGDDFDKLLGILFCSQTVGHGY